MTKKYYGLQVHTLTFLKVDKNGESIDGKQYEYTGDHSGFCDGIDDEYLEEVKGEQKTRISKTENTNTSQPLARGQRLQATSRKLQASSRKLDKKTL